MGKFAGFWKRVKNIARSGVNTVMKGIRSAKKFWNENVTKPGVETINGLLPITKPLTDLIFKYDDKVNKGIDWIINKTENTTKTQPRIQPSNPTPQFNINPSNYERLVQIIGK